MLLIRFTFLHFLYPNKHMPKNNPFVLMASKVLCASGERLKSASTADEAWQILGVVVNFITQADIRRQQEAMEQQRTASMDPKLRQWEQELMTEIELDAAGLLS